MRSKHINSGNCEKCASIFDSYADFHTGLRDWFLNFQSQNPEAHISAAGRGKADQEADFEAGRSNAHWGQSPHNFNAAVDVFKLLQTGASWDRQWFTNVMAPDARGAGFVWGGDWRGKLGDYPHVEVADWKELVAKGILKLVE